MSEFNQTKYMNDWQKEKLDRINLTVPKGQKEKIKQIAKSKGFSSTNAYLQSLINKDIKE